MSSPAEIAKPPNAPPLALTLTEFARAGVEFATLATRLRALLDDVTPGEGRPVLLLPGYGGGDASMSLMRHALRRLGYWPHTLGLGINYESAQERILRVEDAVRFRRKMTRKTRARIREIHRQTRQRVSLVGWSMGGLYAFDAAQEDPGPVAKVITLGSPFGDPRGTSLFHVMRRLNRSNVPIDEQDFDSWLGMRRVRQHDLPVRIVYSRRDGIVAPEVARLDDHPAVEHFEVDSSHVGFCVNPDALRIVARELGRVQ